MAGVQDLVSLLQMFAGAGGQPAAAAALPAMSVGPMSPQFRPPANPPMPPSRPPEFGGAVPSPESVDPSTPATTGTVLARLRGKRESDDGGILGSISSAIPGALSAKTNGSKFGAFAQGFAGGMKATNEERQRLREADTADAKATRDENYRRDVLSGTNTRADAALASQERRHGETLEETKRAHDSLDRYRNTPAVNPMDDPITKAATIVNAEAKAAKWFGLNNPNATRQDRADSQRQFDTWRSKQPWADKPATPQPGSVAPAPAAGAAPAPGVAVPAAPAAPVVVAPPSGAIDALKKNPALREQFDQKFGPGSSQKVLGQ